MTHLEQIFVKLNVNRENGLFFSQEDNWANLFSSRVERLLKNVINPDAFFCIDNKPFILFFENPKNKRAKLKEIWNFNESPIIIIVEQDSVEIYNGFKFESKNDSLQLFGKKDSLNDFKYFELVTGSTWEKYQNDFSYNNRVDYHLLNNIKDARKLLIDCGLKVEVANSLLGKLIFVRYLIDRKVRLNFGGNSHFWTNQDFCQLLLDKHRVKSFFDYLSDKFNGDIFPIENEYIDNIPDACFHVLIRLLQGEQVLTGQISLFNLYDFSIIPVEFISNIYELFIGQEKQEIEGAYYTPLFLVDYILSETIEKKLQKKRQSYSCKVLDPACGSGIFLVESLRKIIEQYQYCNPSYNENVDQYKNGLKQLVLNNIFGVDKDKSAIEVAIFSINLTLLDYQTPSDIESFKFPVLLGKNFFVADFFDVSSEFNIKFKGVEFDFILGNPPWKRGKGESLNPNFVQYIKDRRKLELNTKGRENRPQVTISNNEIAQAFTLRTSDFSNPKTQCALIVTSKALYNLNAKGFRQYFLNQYFLNKVLELAPVRKEVFEKAISDSSVGPAAILFFKNAFEEETGNNVVEHITLKPNRFFTLFKVFTIQRSDYKRVAQLQLKKFDFLWKVLVYGNYMDFNFIRRLYCEYPSLHETIEDKHFLKGQGIQNGSNKNPVDELYGMPFIDSQKVQPFYINSDYSEYWENQYAHRVRNKALYKAPMLLIRKGLSNSFRKKSAISLRDAVFKDSLTSVKVFDQEDIKYLKIICGLLSSSLFAYFVLHTGSSTGIEREQGFNEGMFSFPFLEIAELEEIISRLESEVSKEYNSQFGEIETKHRISQLLAMLDSFVINYIAPTDVEQSIIEYANRISIPYIMKHKGYEKIFKPLSLESPELNNYVDLFLNRFNPIHKSRDLKLVVEVKHSNQIVGLFFKLIPLKENTPDIIWTKATNDEFIQIVFSLGVKKVTDRLFVQKDVRGFEKNGFYIIKPNEVKLWHKAVAHFDLTEFMDAILRTGKKQTVNV